MSDDITANRENLVDCILARIEDVMQDANADTKVDAFNIHVGVSKKHTQDLLNLGDPGMVAAISRNVLFGYPATYNAEITGATISWVG